MLVQDSWAHALRAFVRYSPGSAARLLTCSKRASREILSSFCWTHMNLWVSILRVKSHQPFPSQKRNRSWFLLLLQKTNTDPLSAASALVATAQAASMSIPHLKSVLPARMKNLLDSREWMKGLSDCIKGLLQLVEILHMPH